MSDVLMLFEWAFTRGTPVPLSTYNFDLLIMSEQEESY